MAATTEGIKVTVNSDSTSRYLNGQNGEQVHTSLVSSNQKRHYGTVNKGQWKANGFLIHKIQDTDTLQGIALRYEVPVTEIQRINRLFSNDTIHLHEDLKIPYCVSPSSSPIITHKSRTDKQTNTLSLSEDSYEEDVKHKPLSLSGGGGLSSSGEKDISSLLNAVDEQLKLSRNFAEKLAKKNAASKSATDAYNRMDEEQSKENLDTITDKVKRTFKRGKKWTLPKDNEDEMFAL